MFYQLTSLQAHRNTHNDIKQFVCDICDKRFSQLCRMKEHRDKHSNGKTKKCDASFQQLSSHHGLQVHKKTNHEVDLVYDCVSCLKKCVLPFCDDCRGKLNIMKNVDLERSRGKHDKVDAAVRLHDSETLLNTTMR